VSTVITDRLRELIAAALERAAADGVVSFERQPTIALERPKRREHGDWSSNVALALGDRERSPRAVAEALSERLPSSDVVARVEVAGPGFLNFHLAPAWLHDVVRRAADPGSDFARTDGGARAKVGRVNVEYVSANPTGPANVVSGRHAAYGDAVANLLEATGHDVTREYYVNDAGRQMELFARSVEARYLQSFGVPAELPEDGYRGDYITDLAKDIANDVGDELVHAEEDRRLAELRVLALERTLESIRASLERFGTRYDVWFSEASLHARGAVGDAVERLRTEGWLEERDGAQWFLTSRLGDDKDRVIVRADGTPTYLAADAAYMLDKFERGFERLIYVLGSGHHGTLPRFRAIADALGFGRERLEFPLVQNVTIVREGLALQASKRAGVIVPLDELVDEVGADPVRYTFLTRSLDAPLEFDVDAVKDKAPDNPVYYTQYAHARISSILRRAEGEGIAPVREGAPLDALRHPSEDALMRKLASFEEVVPDAARARAPQKITRYGEELASDFSAFYRDGRVIGDDAGLTRARLELCVATKRVLADSLRLLGIGAPEEM
jgi:arginyl-tRNA synthetase